MVMQNRRQFLLSSTVLGALAGSALRGRAANAVHPAPLTLGVASYTFRKFTRAQALAFTRRLGIHQICFKSFHLPLDSSPKECAAAAAEAKAAGITLWGGGVITLKTPGQVRQAFQYARAAGMRCIVGVPYPEVMDLVEQHIKTFDIAVAIHNHGPGDHLYPLPTDAYRRIQGRDPRLGLCVDIGHTVRAGGDLREQLRHCRDRLLDLHVKDVNEAGPRGHAVEVGRGVIDIPAFLRTLREIGYQHLLSFEYEPHPDDPLPGLAESVGYVRGVLATLA
jgi:sugar phosphate isomerase/epimerase